MEGFCFFDDIVFSNSYDRNDDLRCTGTDFNITNFYCIHVFFLLSSILTLTFLLQAFLFHARIPWYFVLPQSLTSF